MELITFEDFPEYFKVCLGAFDRKNLPEIPPHDPSFAQIEKLCETLKLVSNRYKIGVWSFSLQSSFSQRRIKSVGLMIANDTGSTQPLPALVIAETVCDKLGISYGYDRQITTYTAKYSETIKLSFHGKT